MKKLKLVKIFVLAVKLALRGQENIIMFRHCLLVMGCSLRDFNVYRQPYFDIQTQDHALVKHFVKYILTKL